MSIFFKKNKITIYNQFLLPHTDDLVDSLVNSKDYGGLDLRSRYRQLCLAEEGFEHTAFIMQLG